MLEKGISMADIRRNCYQNALDVFGQSGQMKGSDWLSKTEVDQREKFQDNSILEWGQTPVVGDVESSNTLEDNIVR